MSSESLITIISGVIETGAIGFLVYIIIRGLKTQVVSLKQTIDIQGKTIEAMDKRLLETEKLSEMYRKFIDDYPKAFESYKTTIVKSKDDIIIDLQERVEKQKIIIEDLNGKIDNLSPAERKLFERVSGNLIDPKYKSLMEFIQKFEMPKEKVIYDIIRSNTIEDVMKANGYELLVEQNIDFSELISGDIKGKRMRTGSFGMTGLAYAFTFEKQLIMNSRGKDLIVQQIEEIKR